MKILFIQKRILFPVDTGWKIRTLNVLKHLAGWHDVTYLCNLQSGEEEFVPAMRELRVQLETIPWRETPRGGVGFYRDLLLNIFSPYPFTVNKDYNRRLRRRAAELLSEQTFDLVVCDFVQMARNVVGLQGPPKLLFQHNVEAEIYRRHAANGPTGPRRGYMTLQSRKMRHFEAHAGGQFDGVVAVSERDREIFTSEYGWRHVHTIDTAVDTDYFQPNGCPKQSDRLVFVGSMDWLPNIDAARHFVRDIWPHIRASRGQAKFQLVGRNPDAAVQRLNDVEGVDVVGTVPDVRPYLAEASVVVVPLLVGGGTRIKIFEAMAMGNAVVSTSLGAEGLDVQPGKHIELADSPKEFADKVVSLLENDTRRKELGDTARDHVCRHFSAEAVARQFHRICRRTADGAAARPD